MGRKDMDLRTAIETINKVIYDGEGKRVTYIDITLADYTGDIGVDQFIGATERLVDEVRNSVPKSKVNEVKQAILDKGDIDGYFLTDQLNKLLLYKSPIEEMDLDEAIKQCETLIVTLQNCHLGGREAVAKLIDEVKRRRV